MSRRMVLTASGYSDDPPRRRFGRGDRRRFGRADLVAQDGDIVVLAQKIVSKPGSRRVRLRDVEPSPGRWHWQPRC